MTWHIARTRSLIEAAFGHDQLDLARPSLKSVVDRQEYARYHYQEAMRLLARFTDEYLTHKPLIAVIWSNDHNDRLAFEELMTQLGAHSIACVQSIHALSDILAHMLYFSLGLNRVAELKEQNVNATTVTAVLKADPTHVELAHCLDHFTSGDSFNHLAALANHSKHRSIVQPRLNEDLSGLRADRHEVRFSSFTYKGTAFPEVTIKSLLESEYARCAELVVGTGEKLNHALSRIAS